MSLIICNPVFDDLTRSPGPHPAPSAAPSGCRWCGIPGREHTQQRRLSAPRHPWQPPTTVQILARMRARRAARLTARAALYHVVTAEVTTWSYLSDTPSTDEYCADCGDDDCARWIRIQERIDDRRDRCRRQQPTGR
ncbi:hypothetical protein [Streptomyces flaveolus]|uniref:hypothetical protein n=1 Tax=Streptomyces flaveolus TaxID=67297 RepID=UPI0033314E73